MTKKILTGGFLSLMVVLLNASPALSKHRHSFEGGFQDELGRIGAHAAVNLGANLLGSILNGSGLYNGGPGLINRHPSQYRRPVEQHHEHHHYYPPRRKIIRKEVYENREYYPRRYRGNGGYRSRERHYYEDSCDYHG